MQTSVIELLNEYDENILYNHLPNVLELYIPQCTACVLCTDTYEELAEINRDEFNFYRLEVSRRISDQNSAQHWNLSAVPTFLVFDPETPIAPMQEIIKTRGCSSLEYLLTEYKNSKT